MGSLLRRAEAPLTGWWNQSRSHLWSQKQARGKGLLQALMLKYAASYHVTEDTIRDVLTKIEAI